MEECACRGVASVALQGACDLIAEIFKCAALNLLVLAKIMLQYIFSQLLTSLLKE